MATMRRRSNGKVRVRADSQSSSLCLASLAPWLATSFGSTGRYCCNSLSIASHALMDLHARAHESLLNPSPSELHRLNHRFLFTPSTSSKKVSTYSIWGRLEAALECDNRIVCCTASMRLS
ncbi:hypothetical protein KC352_g80 [Hortaea werneckii]|nr:hypothetical protein KC352_g80 [Hortaea werneckii]